MKAIARQIFSLIVVGLVASARLQNVAVGAEMANDQKQRLSIAVPDFTSDGTSGRDVAQTIIADLEADGRFTLVNSSNTLEANAVKPRLDRWRSANAEWLVAGSIMQSADLENGKSRAHLEIRLWNVVKGTHVLGEQYYAQSTDLRRVSHCVAAHIIKQLTSGADPSEKEFDCD